MVKPADVVIENSGPGVKFRLGIDCESVRSINKRIVYGSISGVRTGPIASVRVLTKSPRAWAG
jgi:crotonobetainyl-CoA:carnitine CoA-transferase CaiB-like acyl-CoA transferase